MQWQVTKFQSKGEGEGEGDNCIIIIGIQVVKFNLFVIKMY